MCRLIGFAAPVPTTLTELVGADQVALFRDMCRLHRDGWGSAWLEPGLRSHRSTGPVPDVLDPTPTTARVVHLRWATEGLAVVPEHTHPFVEDGIALSHNGSISPRTALEELLAPGMLGKMHGITDSERYLAVIRAEAAGASGHVEAVARAVAKLRGRFPLASLNALILTESALIVVHASNGSLPPFEDMVASGIRELPRGHGDDYFHMFWRHGPHDSLVFSSTGLDNEGWEPLPPESITTVDLASMRVSQEELIA
jgi:gamma-glutamyl hercynylcysteine S-oxide hydrolase